MALPKVISLFRQERFEDRFPEIPILGEPTNLFVECMSYDVQFPVAGVPSRSLDIFEEAVLRTVRLRGASVNGLADILCLDKDLVWFILNRLMEKGRLDNALNLTNKGIRQLNLRSKQKMEIRQIQGRVFVLKKTGQILPYIHTGEFQSEKVDELTGKRIVLGFGSAGNAKTVAGLRIRNTDYEPSQDSRLPNQQLREAVLRFNRLMILGNRKQIDLCPGYAIDSSRNEPVYFHLQAVIQDGNSDEILFSDGFVPNIDGMLEYTKSYPDAISDIRSRAVRMVVSADGAETKSHPVRRRYWEIVRNYDKVQRYLPDKPYEDATPDERKEMDKNKRQIAIDCYHILETAFLYYLKENPVSETMMDVLRRQTAAQNGRTVLMMAESLGMRHTSEAKRLLSHLDGSRISSVFETDTAHMHVCLPLAIAEAKESPDSRIRILIQKDGGFLRFLQRLSDATAKFRHDADASGDELDMLAEYITEETSNIACVLLPSLCLGDGDVQISDADGVSQARLLAQASLSKAFGPICFQMMSKGLKNEWMRISPDKTGKDLPEMDEYAQILYRILQTSLANANREFPHRSSISKDEAIRRLMELYGKPLPKSIASVTEAFYKSAAQGGNSSLGAEALVFAATHDGMDALIKAEFVQSVDRILRLRGHGSQSASLTEDEHTMGALRDNVIELIKMIGG